MDGIDVLFESNVTRRGLISDETGRRLGLDFHHFIDRHHDTCLEKLSFRGAEGSTSCFFFLQL